MRHLFDDDGAESLLGIHVNKGLDRYETQTSDCFINESTGHPGRHTLSYTHEIKGVIDVKKNVMINHQFQEARALLSYLVGNGIITDTSFINPTPDMGFVQYGGAEVEK